MGEVSFLPLFPSLPRRDVVPPLSRSLPRRDFGPPSLALFLSLTLKQRPLQEIRELLRRSHEHVVCRDCVPVAALAAAAVLPRHCLAEPGGPSRVDVAEREAAEDRRASLPAARPLALGDLEQLRDGQRLDVGAAREEGGGELVPRKVALEQRGREGVWRPKRGGRRVRRFRRHRFQRSRFRSFVLFQFALLLLAGSSFVLSFFCEERFAGRERAVEDL